MEMEHKAAPKGGGMLLEDEGDGIVTALVSVTGIVDNVKDIILPGAYKRTLMERKPKGIWHHSWTDPIAKTLEIEELMPGDPRLPGKLANGKAWPREAGALLVKMQFNLDSDLGRRAYSNVKFYGDEQEWSIGYQVPTGGGVKDQKTGVRRIKDIDLYEYSPVLFGAMTHARTVGQAKAMLHEWVEAGIDLKELMNEMGNVELKTKPLADPEDDEDVLDDYADEEFEDDADAEEEGEPRKHKGLEADTLRKAITALSDLLDAVGEAEQEDAGPELLDDEKHAPVAYIEAKALEHLTLTEALDALTFDVPEELQATASVFDDAYAIGNEKAMEKSGMAVMGLIEKFDDEVGVDEKKHNDLQVVVQVVSDMFSNRDVKNAEGSLFNHFSTEFKMVDIESREGGWPVCKDGTVSRKTLQQAYLSQLGDDDLIEVADWLSEQKSDRAMLRFVESTLEDRRDEDDNPTSEQKSIKEDPQVEEFVFDIKELADAGIELDD